MNNKTMNVAMIGSGFMGKAHSCAYNAINTMMPGVQKINCHTLTTLDDNPELFSGRWGWQNIEKDWRAILDNPEIDIVDICVPGHLHAPVALEAARKGKHVLCEKPLALSFYEAEHMTAVAREMNIVHGVSFNYRFIPAIKLAKQYIQNGRLGRIRHFRASYLQDWLVDSSAPMSWRLRRETAGTGVHGDLGAHIIDLGHYLVGQITEVTGMMKTFVNQRPHETESGVDAVTVDDACSFLACFADGAMGTFEVSRMATGRKNANCIEIYGEKGALKFDLERMNELEFCDATQSDAGFKTILATDTDHPWIENWWPAGHVLGWQHAHTNLMYEFLTAVEGKSRFEPSFVDGLQCQKVLDAVELSSNTRHWQTIESII